MHQLLRCEQDDGLNTLHTFDAVVFTQSRWTSYQKYAQLIQLIQGCRLVSIEVGDNGSIVSMYWGRCKCNVNVNVNVSGSSAFKAVGCLECCEIGSVVSLNPHAATFAF